MKREELEAIGLTKEQIDKVLDAHHQELSSVQKELQKATEDLKAQTDKATSQKATIDELNKALDGFKDVDVSALKKQITDLEENIKTKDAEYQKTIADRDFQDILKESIVSAKGLNAKAITSLLDVETLKASKNQKDDITAAINVLKGAEDSKMLFGSDDEPENKWVGNPIGTVKKTGGNGDDLSSMRAAMGLPVDKKE